MEISNDDLNSAQPLPTKDDVPWYRNRVFLYAIVLRLWLSLLRGYLPPSIRGYLYDNAALQSLTTHPWWTVAHVREEVVHWHWLLAQQGGATGTVTELALTHLLQLSTTWPVQCLGALALIAVDFMIAHYLNKLLYRYVVDSKDADDIILNDMPQVIQPEYQFPFPREVLPRVISLLYFANPLVIFSSAVYGCFSNIKLLCLVVAMYYYRHDRKSPSAWMTPVFLGVVAYLDTPWAIFSLALTNLRDDWDRLVFTFSILHLLEYFVTGAVQFRGLPASSEILQPPPSLSVLWYTYMEFFVRFAPYLQIFLGYLPYIAIIPLAIRLCHRPMVLVASYWMILHTLCQPVSTLTDLLVGLLFLCLSPTACVRMNPIITVGAICGIGVPVTLYTVLHPMWLVSNVGEANFIYFQCLAYQIMVANILLQFVSGALQSEKALRLTVAQKK